MLCRLFQDLKDTERLAELGVLFLLFEMGLELSLDRLKVRLAVCERNRFGIPQPYPEDHGDQERRKEYGVTHWLLRPGGKGRTAAHTAAAAYASVPCLTLQGQRVMPYVTPGFVWHEVAWAGVLGPEEMQGQSKAAAAVPAAGVDATSPPGLRHTSIRYWSVETKAVQL